MGGNVIEKEMVAECKPLLHCHLPIKFNELNEYTNLNNLATIKVINMYYIKILWEWANGGNSKNIKS